MENPEMKTLFLSVLSLLVVGTQAHAENRAGVLGGVNLAKFSGDNDSSDTHTGLLAGVFYQAEVAPAFYIEPQLRFNRRGGDVTGTLAGQTGSAQTGLSYLDLPVYAKYKFNAGSFAPFVFAGPNFGFKIGGTQKFVVNGNTISEADADGVKTFDLGLDFGLGGEVALTEGLNLSISGSYSLGLLDIVDAGTLKNRGIQVYAGLSWAY